jgi:predicted dehydrogenase
MIKAAVVGLGWWGRQIVTSLSDSDLIEIRLGVDISPEASMAFGKENGFDVIDSYQSALENPDIDAVILVTPHGLHEEQVLAAAAASKHIFCEKPLALTGQSVDRMLQACDSRNIVLGVGHERRFEGALEEAKRMVDDGELGTLAHLEINWSHNLFANAPATGWRQDGKQAPGGTLTALGIHMTDFMISVAGAPKEVFAQTSHRSDKFPGDDVISIQIRFESGVTGYLCSIATTPFHQTIRLYGDQGWVESSEISNVDKPDPATLKWRGLDDEIHQQTFKQTNTVRANLESWADAVEGRGSYRFSREEKLQNIQLLEAIVKSAATNSLQSIQ